LPFATKREMLYLAICYKARDAIPCHLLQSERCCTLSLEESLCETDMEGKGSEVCSIPRPLKYNLSYHNNSCTSCRKCNWPEMERIGYYSKWCR